MVGSTGGRLREERKRLGMSQADFAELAGKTSKSQERYEADERQPDAAYLAALARHGVDILYVVIGQRTPGHDLIQEVRTRYGSVLELGDLAENIERLTEAEAAAGNPTKRDDLERWATAIATVEEGLVQAGRLLDAAAKAELILAAYDLLAEATPSSRERVIRLVSAA